MNKENGTVKEQANRIKGRKLKVLHGRVMRQTMQEIADDVGVNISTVSRDCKELREMGVTRDLITQEREIHKRALPLATVCILSAIKEGDVDTACKMVKGLQVWRDKVDVGTGQLESMSDDEITNQVKAVIVAVVKNKKQEQGLREITHNQENPASQTKTTDPQDPDQDDNEPTPSTTQSPKPDSL